MIAVIVLVAMTGDRHDGSAEAPADPPRANRSNCYRCARRRGRYAGGDRARAKPVPPRRPRPSPPSSPPLTEGGRVVASGSAPLTTLAPGDESPFVVTIPHVAGSPVIGSASERVRAWCGMSIDAPISRARLLMRPLPLEDPSCVLRLCWSSRP